jgi:iron-sulfur cluster repair protein YtfE (RIC family)
MTIPCTIDTGAVRREHREILAPRLDALRRVADSVGTAPVEEVRRGVEETYEFLVHDLIPHAEWEDAILYPAVDQALGAPGATATMSREHEDIRDLAEELENVKDDLRGETLGGALTCSLRRILCGLHTLVGVHFAKEEEIYLPVLEEQPGLRRHLVAAEPTA